MNIDPTAYIAPTAVIVGDVTLEAESSIWYGAVIRGDEAPIVVGAQSTIQDLTVIHVAAGLPCRVGKRVGVGHRAILHGCAVDDECLVGMGSVLLNGVWVGTGSVIGAGAVLPEGTEVPPRSLVLGVPGRVVRSVDEELARRITVTWQNYLRLARQHRDGRFARAPQTDP